MATSRFNKWMWWSASTNKQGLFGQKSPSLRCTGLTKQVFLSLSLKRLLWLSLPLPYLLHPWNSSPLPATVWCFHVHLHALAGHFLTSAQACVVSSNCLSALSLSDKLVKAAAYMWRGEHACFPPLVRTSEQSECSGMCWSCGCCAVIAYCDFPVGWLHKPQIIACAPFLCFSLFLS